MTWRALVVCPWKTALVNELTCDTPEAERGMAMSLFAAEPNLDPEEVRAILERVPPKAVDHLSPLGR